MNNPALWRIDMLGQLRVSSLHNDQIITKFRTQKTGLLLAYLAYFADKPHPREVLTELLWPESAPEAGRHNLCNALSALRHALEPDGIPAGSVFLVNRFSLQINPSAIVTDSGEFAEAFRLAGKAGSPTEQRSQLGCALERYGGLLLPGYYEDWILAEQQRLQEQFFLAVRMLAATYRSEIPTEEALEYARRAVRMDPLHEENRTLLIELLVQANQITSAKQQYREYVDLRHSELGEKPSPALRHFMEQLPDHTPLPLNPPARPLSQGNLPVRLTRFFGRTREQERLHALLVAPETRLVTLTGPGGIGKTRLALEVAEKLQPAFAGAVWFVPLTDLTQAEPLYCVLLNALVPCRATPEQALEQLVEMLAGRNALLVLDNFEHLVEEGALRVQTLLERLPLLTCLVTSRQRLHLSFEKVFSVDPLPLSNGARLPEEILRCESIRLFIDRAQAVYPNFEVTAQNAPVLAELCDRLEGIPLATELAAARSQVLTPQQMLRQIERRFDFLADQQRDRSQRHHSLRATLDWSYRLLSPEVQRFFVGLSVFRGGWTAEQAAEVCEEPQALDLLTQLHDGSLLQTALVGGDMRFRMLETVREYTNAQLQPQDRDRLTQRHSDLFLAFAESLAAALEGPEAETAIERFEAEQGNFRAVLERAQCLDREAGLRLGVALYRFWTIHGSQSEGRQRLEVLLFPDGQEPTETPTLLRAKALYAAGYMAQEQGDYERAATLQEASLALYRQFNYLPGIAASLRSLGVLARRHGDAERAIALYEESLRLHRQIGDRRGVASLLNSMGIAVFRQGDPGRAQELYEQGLAQYRQLDDRAGIAQVLNNLGDLRRRQGHTAQAIELLEESVALHRQTGNRNGVASALNSLAAAYLKQGDLERAAAHYQESLLLMREAKRTWGVCEGLEGCAEIAFHRKQWAPAVRLFAAAAAQREKTNAPLGPLDSAYFEQIRDNLYAHLGGMGFDRAWFDGKILSWEQAIDLALSL